MALGPDGSILVSDSWLGVVKQVSRSGHCQTVPLGTLIGNLTWAPVWCDASGRITFSVWNDLQRYDPKSGLRTPLVYSSMVYGIRDGGLGEASVGEVRGMVGDHQGNIYFLDSLSESDYRIAQFYLRRLSPDGALVTLAGGGQGFVDGPGGTARFNVLRGLAMDPQGNLIVADQGNQAIRRVTPRGDVSTIAGGSGPGFSDGPALQAKFNGPTGVAVDAEGTIYVADTNNAAIRLISTDGQVSTLLGNPAQPGTRAGSTIHGGLFHPMGILVNADGDLLVTDSGCVLQFTAPKGH